MNKIKQLGLGLVALFMVSSCTTVDSGHRGVEVSWGGKTNMEKTYGEGMHTGTKWLTNDMIDYNVKEQTIVHKFEFNDKNNMVTRVELSLDYSLNPEKVNFLHKGIDDVDLKLEKTLKSAGKEVIPQYSSIELNITKRTEAEKALEDILKVELPEFFLEFVRVQMTDVDIPAEVSKLATKTAVQIGKNELASKLKQEKENIADALIAESKGKFEAAEYDAKTKDIMSQPKMLKLFQLENERIIAKGYLAHGKSLYGTNNWFGANSASVIKGLK